MPTWRINNMFQGIAASLIMNKLGQGTKIKQVETPRPQMVDLGQFRVRSRKRTGYSGKSKAAPVVGSALTATSKYNSVLRKLLNITKYS